MNCPACANQLRERIVRGVTLDLCENGCGGIFFDNFELKQFERPAAAGGEAPLNIRASLTIPLRVDKKRSCPKCKGVFMMRHFFSAKKQIVIDTCPSCGGCWLDAGELAVVRAEFKAGAGWTKNRPEAASKISGQNSFRQRTEGMVDPGQGIRTMNIAEAIWVIADLL